MLNTSLNHSLNYDKLQSQFLNYLTLTNEDIPKTLQHAIVTSWTLASWWALKCIKIPDRNCFQFDLLFQVAEVIMTIQYSNAADERIFSMINKNNPLSTKSIKWSNTLKQIVGKLPMTCLSLFDHFVGLALKGIKQAVAVLHLWVAHYCPLSYWRHILITTHFNGNRHKTW